MIYVVALLALVGHAAMFVAVVNRYHAMITERAVLKMLDVVWCVLAVGIPLAAGSWLLHNVIRGGNDTQSAWFFPICAYTSLCLAATVCAIIHRAAYTVRNSSTTSRLVSNHTELVSLSQQLGYRPTDDWVTKWCSRIPGNEILKLSIHRKHLQLARLDPALDGFTITHLSDLHLTGRMSKDFYRSIVDAALELSSDMIVITGDIIEKKSACPGFASCLGGLMHRSVCTTYWATTKSASKTNC